MTQENGANAGIFPLLLFGYALAVLAAQLLIAPDAAGALVFAILVAGIAETAGGFWQLSQGRNYLGSVFSTFGIWLIGLFFLQTVGHSLGMVSPQTLAVYFLLIVIPAVLLAIPAFKHQMPWQVRGVFAALILLLLAAGVNSLLGSSVLRVAAGAFSLVSAFCIWGLAAADIAIVGEQASAPPPPH